MNLVTAPATGTPVQSPASGFLRASLGVTAVLVAASWWFILAGGGQAGAMAGGDSFDQALRFLRGFVGLAEDGTIARTRSGEALVPAYLQWDRWVVMAGLAIETLAMSVLAIALAGVGMLCTVLPAARTAATGVLLLGSPTWAGRVTYWLVRAMYILTRGIPELVWAMLLLFVFAPGILPGALALGIHNLGIVGKLCAEVVEDLNPRPIQALRTSGASSAQVVLYGVLPQVLPQFLTYVVYRWEVIIRTTIVVGFVSAGGLGREFRLAMSYFHYTDIALILMVYVLLVIAVDLIGAGLRRLAV